ncbi:Hypothetical protein FKW44_015915 [Caligus rogercresseyi]|uniref:Uncharacterized protein n=1 Tax=Caligus rogercresseyi TaxID=217165 RepID=A0A7T8H1B3_CALRO|nr:Hypothetical protein FKW44_015915 [Caligus rogercresseyi]
MTDLGPEKNADLLIRLKAIVTANPGTRFNLGQKAQHEQATVSRAVKDLTSYLTSAARPIC